MKTSTGGFPIGFRYISSEWQKDLAGVIRWAKDSGFEVMDLGRNGDQAGQQIVNAGLRLGSVDLAEWEGMISSDKAKCADAIAKNTAYIQACAACGVVNHFIVMLPQNPDLPRRENFGYMLESFSQLAPVLEQNKARLVVEGWPGPGRCAVHPKASALFLRRFPLPRWVSPMTPHI